MGNGNKKLSAVVPNVFIDEGTGLTIAETVRALAARGIETTQDAVRVKLSSPKYKIPLKAIGYRSAKQGKGVPSRVYDTDFFEKLVDAFSAPEAPAAASPAPAPSADATAAIELLNEQILKLAEAVEENTKAVNRLQSELFSADLPNGIKQLGNMLSGPIHKDMSELRQALNSLSLRSATAIAMRPNLPIKA